MSSSSICQSQITLKKTSRQLYGRTLENCRKIMAGLRCHTEVYYKRRSLFWLRMLYSYRILKPIWLQWRMEALWQKVKVVEDTNSDSSEKPEAEKRGEKLEMPNSPEFEFDEKK